MRNVTRKLRAYSRMFEATPTFVEPRDERELRGILLARRQGQRITFRAGGCAFDRQSLNTGLVVSLRKLDCIRVDPVEPLVRVGPGATWGAIMEAVLPHGLVPAVTVTTSRATAGGTLSANALSRFSSAYGKEGGRVAEARIMTLDGAVHRCVPPPGERPWTDPERLFMGAVGGLGYLGVFVEITYRLLELKDCVRVRTRVERCPDLEDFARRLTGAAEVIEGQESDPCRGDRDDAVYGTLYTNRRRRQGLFFASSYTADRGKPMLPHQPRHPLRPLVELGLSTPLKYAVWSQGYRRLPARSPYVDPAADFAFLMDGNVRSMRLWRWVKIVQQTYVIPRPRLAEWLEAAAVHIATRKLQPTLQDVVALPKDRPFCLTVNPDAPAFAVTYTFMTWTRRSITQKIEPALSALSDMALAAPFEGRVSLVKNVFADRATVQAMFGSQVGDFADLREHFGADGILVNAFYDDTLGPGPGAGGTRPAPDGG